MKIIPISNPFPIDVVRDISNQTFFRFESFNKDDNQEDEDESAENRIYPIVGLPTSLQHDLVNHLRKKRELHSEYFFKFKKIKVIKIRQFMLLKWVPKTTCQFFLL
jgi:hypothetical protein